MTKPKQKARNLLQKGVQRALSPLQSFMQIEASSGILLLGITLIALLLANFPSAPQYFAFINLPISISVGGFTLNKTLLLLVNDGLMAIFFYMVGLEIRRELLVGELSSPKKASFSIFAAIGGMIFPALIYLFFNSNSDYVNGWGIPMATDIAFALGIITLLGKRVPITLKVFLLALAIVDDLGAILVIALFYTNEIHTNYLGFASLCIFLLFLLNYSGVRNIVWGIILGFITWFCFLKSGVHATVAGVVLAFVTPSRPITEDGTLDQNNLILDDYIHSLHPWVAFMIMPIFAFFNAGVSFGNIGFQDIINSPVVLGISLGLILGKTLGIWGMTFIATYFRVAELPKGVTWPQIGGVAMLAGIGFTMSLFISSLAFKGDAIESYSKIGILAGSSVATVLGLLVLVLTLKKS